MAKMRTEIIRYNLKERMRKFNGAERHFNVPALVKDINSSRMQERVKFGDLHGYYGHWARTKFGAEPKEGGVIDGKIVNLEPCFRTVYLKAYEDGTIEHQAEFFDNEPGRKAYSLVLNRSGGFSSVIKGTAFHGFDYVLFPNFNSNRTYDPNVVLDDGTTVEIDDTVLVLDDVGDTLCPALQQDYIGYLLDSIERLKLDNAELVAANTLLGQSMQTLETENALLTDDVLVLKEQLTSAQQQKETAVQSLDATCLDEVINQAERFKTAKLETIDQPEKSEVIAQVEQFSRRWGMV